MRQLGAVPGKTLSARYHLRVFYVLAALALSACQLPPAAPTPTTLTTTGVLTDMAPDVYRIMHLFGEPGVK